MLLLMVMMAAMLLLMKFLIASLQFLVPLKHCLGTNLHHALIGPSPRCKMALLSGAERAEWNAGMASGAVYKSGEDQSSSTTNAYSLCSHSNRLHPDLWPSGRKFEPEPR